MRLEGNMSKQGKYWAADVPLIGVFTQGRTKKEAYDMVADAIEAVINKEGFQVTVYPGRDGYFEVGAQDQRALIAYLLRWQRAKSGLTLNEVSRRMGMKSHNAYARYEQGKAMPTIEQLNRLFSAVCGKDFVLTECAA